MAISAAGAPPVGTAVGPAPLIVAPGAPGVVVTAGAAVGPAALIVAPAAGAAVVGTGVGDGSAAGPPASPPEQPAAKATSMAQTASAAHQRTGGRVAATLVIRTVLDIDTNGKQCTSGAARRPELDATPSANVLQLADYLPVGGTVAPAMADVLPSNGAVPVQDKRRGTGNAAG